MVVRPPMPRRHCWVSGLVQGVSYRAATRRRADDLGLAGWVRNLPDGRVEAVFEGRPEELSTMTAWLARGPPAAQVEKVEVREEPEEGLAGFLIRR